MQITASIVGSRFDLPADSYVYGIVPCSKSVVAAISSDDSLRFVDSTRLQEAGSTFRDIHQGVTCLQTSKDQPSVCLTAGRDAAVRGWDAGSGQRVLELSQRTVAELLSYHRLLCHLDLDSDSDSLTRS